MNFCGGTVYDRRNLNQDQRKINDAKFLNIKINLQIVFINDSNSDFNYLKSKKFTFHRCSNLFYRKKVTVNYT